MDDKLKEITSYCEFHLATLKALAIANLGLTDRQRGEYDAMTSIMQIINNTH